MPTTFLVVSAIGVALALNARRALRGPILLIPSFFASWLVIELAPHFLVLHVAGVGVFVALGGATSWPGWVALGLAALNAYLLWSLVSEAWRSHAVFDDALTAAIGPASAHRPVVWREFVFPFKLWSRKYKRIRDVPYADPGGRRFRLDIWQPAEPGEARPCLLYVPGGAWVSLVSNKNHQAKPLLIEMVAQGWVCFSINYPLSPRAKFPAHIVAVKRAMAWIREHAHEYGADPSFVMISGNSAGAHLSSLAALTPNDSHYQPGFEHADTTVQAAAVFYGVYDFTAAQMDDLRWRSRRHKKGFIRFLERTVVGRKYGTDAEVFEKASPCHRIGEHAPPFFVIHGAMDTLALVEEARAFVERLRAVSNEPVIYAELPRTQHAFDHFLSIRSLYAVRAVARFGLWAYERYRVSGARRGQPSDRDARSPTSPG